MFSQQMVTSTEEYLTQRLGNEGYNFAKVTGIPEIDEDAKTVEMKFFIDPGKRTRQGTAIPDERDPDYEARRQQKKD